MIRLGYKPDHYEVLNLDRKSTLQEIESAFGELVSKFGPLEDISPDDWENIKPAVLAYETLKDPILRKEYDSSLDYDLVLMDSKTKYKELEDILTEYKTLVAHKYYEILANFDIYKKDIQKSLWLMKTTAIFLLANIVIFITGSIIYVIAEKLEMVPQTVENFIQRYGTLITIFQSVIGTIVFRFTYQRNKIKKPELLND
jgi:hypothetical protein